MFNWNKKILGIEINFNLIILLILVLSSTLNFYNISNIGLGRWDAGNYLDAGEYIKEGSIKHLGVGLKPLHNFLIFLGFSIFGVSEAVGAGVSAFFGILSVYLVYLIGRRLFNEKTALVAALILAVSEAFLYNVRSALPDGNLTFFILLTTLFYIYSIIDKKIHYSILTGLFLWISYLTKNSAGVYLGVIFFTEIFLVWTKQEKFKKSVERFSIIAGVSLFLITLTTIGYFVLAPSDNNIAEDKTTGKLLSIAKDFGEGINFEFYPIFLWDFTSFITVILLVLGLIAAFINRKRKDLFLLSWFGFYFLFFTLYPDNQFKVFIPAIPAVALLASYGLNKFKTKILFSALLVLLVGISLFNAADTLKLSNFAYRDASEFVLNDNGVGVITSRNGIFNYYLKRMPLEPTYFLNTTKYDLESLHTQGYTHLMFDWRAERMDREFVNEIFEKSKPSYEVYNGLLNNDPELLQYLKQYPYMKNPDEKARWVEKVTVDDPRNQYIYVFRIEEVLEDLKK